MKLQYLGMVALLPQLMSGVARAQPVPVTDLPALVGQSDFVVSARIDNSDGGRPEVIEIDSVLKGDLQSNTRQARDAIARSMRAKIVRYGIFFLRNSPQGLEIVRLPGVYHDPAYAEAAPLGYTIAITSNDPLALTAARVASVFNLPLRVVGNPKFGLAHSGMYISDHLSITNSRDDPPPHAASELELAEDVYDRALRVLRSVPSSVLTPILMKFITTKPVTIGHEFALALLLTNGDLSGLPLMAEYLQSPPRDANIAHQAVSLGLEQADFDRSKEDFLLGLSGSTSRLLREVAMHKLSGFESRESLRMLALGLNDRDAHVRQTAARGICGRTHICDAESSDFTRPEDLRKTQSQLSDLLSKTGN